MKSKKGDGLLKGMLDMIESDEIARATGGDWRLSNDCDAASRWRPLELTPAVLSLACRKLIASQVFELKPAELRKACVEARRSMQSAYGAADDFCDRFLESDAILLLHNHEQWERPYLSKYYRPLLKRVLELHEESENYWDGPRECEPPSPFQAAVEREQAKLALPKPEQQTNTAIAACAQPPTKKTGKPKRAKKGDT